MFKTEDFNDILISKEERAGNLKSQKYYDNMEKAIQA